MKKKLFILIAFVSFFSVNILSLSAGCPGTGTNDGRCNYNLDDNTYSCDDVIIGNPNCPQSQTPR
jgi:hypothetical protein